MEIVRENKNRFLFDLSGILLALLILLVGMFVVSLITTDEVASFIDIIPMSYAVWFLAKWFRTDKLIGQAAFMSFMSVVFFLTLIILVYSSLYVFSRNGYFHMQESTGIFNEQAWAYDNILKISQLSIDEILGGDLKSLRLDKYEQVFLYNSLMFKAGGDVLTHMCVWRAFHLYISSLLFVQIALRIGIKNEKNLKVILFVCLFQPMFDVFFAYNHDGVGNFFIALGIYLYVFTQNNKLASTLAFPIYTLLFFWFRRPYAIIGVLLYLFVVLRGKNKLNIIVAFASIVILSILLISTIDILDFALNDMGLKSHVVAGETTDESFHGNLFSRILITLISYFPWTNLLTDINWPYHVFACYQGCMFIAMFYYIYKTNIGRFKFVFHDPLFIAALMFFSATMAFPGHASYAVVSAPLFALFIRMFSVRSFFATYFRTIFVLFLLGLIYSTF